MRANQFRKPGRRRWGRAGRHGLGRIRRKSGRTAGVVRTNVDGIGTGRISDARARAKVFARLVCAGQGIRFLLSGAEIRDQYVIVHVLRFEYRVHIKKICVGTNICTTQQRILYSILGRF